MLRRGLLGIAGVCAVIVAAVSMSHPTPGPYHGEKRPEVVPAVNDPISPVVSQEQPNPDPIRSVLPTARPTGLRAIYGDWGGLYACAGQGTNQIGFRIYQVAPEHGDAMVSFSVMQRGMSAPITGTYRSHVTYQPSDGSITLRPEQWISAQPMGFVASPFMGTVDLHSGVIQGQLPCGTFRVVRRTSALQE